MPAKLRPVLLFGCLCTLLGAGHPGLLAAHPDLVATHPGRTLHVPARYTTVLRVQGSNTLGAKLVPALIGAMLERRGLVTVRTQAPDNGNEQTVMAASPAGLALAFEVAAHGSSTGFSALADGRADLAAASRPIHPAECKRLRSLGDMRSAQAEHVIGIDGVAVIVHPANPLRTLTVEQLAAVFAGQITRWEQLGTGHGAIHLFARDARSGTWETFQERVLLPYRATLMAQAVRLESSEQLSQQVSQDPQAIGFVGLAFVLGARALAIADGAAAPIAPSEEAVAMEDYPLSRRLYFYLPPYGANAWAQALLAFTQGPEGQAIVAAQGFVAQTVQAAPMRPVAGMPPAYRALAQRAQRLSVTFRFAEGSAMLDNKAMADIDRLLAFLHTPAAIQGRTVLVGFGDPKGEPGRAALLSRLRAMAVRRELARRGLVIRQVMGFGDERPVANNAAEAGRVRNRRVEVWLD
ncbi:substrate-binding domain-containing protein [Pseudomonas typographi]|uniref:OmpA family protein n=1 Tax=Pseudomonas typographi TaxID=2715964 RepID=A0ABR7Z9F1_9PSED|nr:substrate-binding domain-containing protein [Pseudomonas typographi]MBD1555122.1 OmpA family protein [Pseudomonas typographi]MBD1590160.1 OmpA family protein [Pseudomonas typographi]MBD1602195.1 OmpA family protein [Pseudomonas typographi]